MSSAREVKCAAASSLVTALLDGPERRLPEVARTRLSVHYETADPRLPVLTVCTPAAVRLPATVVTPALPAPGPLAVGRGGLGQGSSRWRVTRWWRPARPVALTAPPHDVRSLLPTGDRPVVVPLPRSTYDGLCPGALVGRGPGLTPAGDDLLAGALVAAHATADPRFARWRAATLDALATTSTTAVSRALLHHACDGYATPELERFLTAVCGGQDPAGPRTRLLAVGHTSGAALAVGVLHTLSTRSLEGAA